MPNNSLLSINDSVNDCQVVNINNHQIFVINYKNQPVLTFKYIDELHQRVTGTAKRIFNENKERFKESVDFHELTSDEIRTMSKNGVFPERTARGILITERGYLKITKSLTDDLAWQVQDALVECYFKAKTATLPPMLDFTDPEQALIFALNKLKENKELLAITHEQAGVIGRKDALIEYQKPKVEFANVVIESDSASPINEATKKIANHNPKCTPNKTRDLMKIKGYLIANEKRDYMPSAAMTMNGYMQYKLVKTWFDREADKTREQWQVRITGKGLEMMLRLCKSYAKFFDYKFQEYEYYLRNPHSEQTRIFLTKIREASRETETTDLLV